MVKCIGFAKIPF